MSYPDRVALFESQQAWQAAQLAPETSPEDSRTHAGELAVAHQGRPTTVMQAKNNGCGPPPVDKGPTPGTVVG